MSCELPTVYQVTQRRARKAHRCCSCNFKGTPSRILAGSVYHEHRGLWDGRWETMKRCDRCERVANALECEMSRGLNEIGESMEPEDCIALRHARRALMERTAERAAWRRDRAQEGK